LNAAYGRVYTKSFNPHSLATCKSHKPLLERNIAENISAISASEFMLR